jgi:hypothetical protein
LFWIGVGKDDGLYPVISEYLEVLDEKTYISALDQTKNTISRNTIFEEIPPVKCRFVRLTMTNWPRTTPPGIIEFTIFGKPADSLPAEVPIPNAQ